VIIKFNYDCGLFYVAFYVFSEEFCSLQVISSDKFGHNLFPAESFLERAEIYFEFIGIH